MTYSENIRSLAEEMVRESNLAADVAVTKFKEIVIITYMQGACDEGRNLNEFLKEMGLIPDA